MQALAVQTAPLFLLLACRRVVLDACCREPKLESGAVAVTIDEKRWAVVLATDGPRKAGKPTHYRMG
jgi:hypothetical protein